MIDWTQPKVSKLVSLHADEQRFSESKIAEMMTNEFSENFSRDAVHNKITRLMTTLTEKKEAKILVFDIETAPNVVYSWGLFKQNISIDQIVRPAYIICWSAKWLFSDTVMSACISPKDAKAGNDKQVVKALWELIDEADIIISHNGDNFDLPWVNGRFMMYDMLPPSPYQSIDTLKVTKKMYFTSRKLDWLGFQLVGDSKIKTSFALWSGCMNGDQESLDNMVVYNRQDVQLLEEVYIKLRPWVKSHPNMGMYLDTDEKVCANCGGLKLTELTKPYRATVNIYQTYRCEACGAVNRVRKGSKSATLISVAR